MFNKKRYTQLFILLCILFFILGVTHSWILINVIVLGICLVALKFDRFFILFLYLIFLPTNGLISTEYNLLGIFNLQRTLNLFAIVVLIIEKNNLRVDKSDFNKYARLFILFLLTYCIYVEIKNLYYSLFDITQIKAFNHIIKYFLLFISSALFIRHIKDEKIYSLFEYTLVIAILFLVVTQIFGSQLHQIGFLTQGIFDNEFGVSSNDLGRSGGFFGFGDQNSFGAFLVITVGYYLSCSEVEKNFVKLIPIILISAIGIVITGSRNAIGSFILIFFIYFLRNWKSSKVLLITVLFVCISLFTYTQTSFFDKAISRFESSDQELDKENLGSRQAKWLIYLNFMQKNPDYLAFGSHEEIRVIKGRYRAAHNFYISVFYNGGLLFLGYLLILYIKLISFSRKGKNKYFFLFTFLPFLTISFIVSDWGYFFYFVFFLALNEKKLLET